MTESAPFYEFTTLGHKSVENAQSKTQES